MSAVHKLLADIETRGIRLTAKGERLVVDGPEDVVTDVLLARLRSQKAALLSELRASKPCCSAQVLDRSIHRPRLPRATKAYDYLLTDSPNWLVLITPGNDLHEASRSLQERFGDRLIKVRPHV